jgi:hypothetical protein
MQVVPRAEPASFGTFTSVPENLCGGGGSTIAIGELRALEATRTQIAAEAGPRVSLRNPAQAAMFLMYGKAEYTKTGRTGQTPAT